MTVRSLWGLLWLIGNKKDGYKEELVREYNGRMAKVFPTRKEALAWYKEHYGYLNTRPVFKSQPHGWRVARPVRVTVLVTELIEETTT